MGSEEGIDQIMANAGLARYIDNPDKYVDVINSLISRKDHRWMELWERGISEFSNVTPQFAIMNPLLYTIERVFVGKDSDLKSDAFICWQYLIELLEKLDVPTKVCYIVMQPLIANNHSDYIVVEAKLKAWATVLNTNLVIKASVEDKIFSCLLKFLYSDVNSKKYRPACHYKFLVKKCAEIYLKLIELLPFYIQQTDRVVSYLDKVLLTLNNENCTEIGIKIWRDLLRILKNHSHHCFPKLINSLKSLMEMSTLQDAKLLYLLIKCFCEEDNIPPKYVEENLQLILSLLIRSTLPDQIPSNLLQTIARKYQNDIRFFEHVNACITELLQENARDVDILWIRVMSCLGSMLESWSESKIQEGTSENLSYKTLHSLLIFPVRYLHFKFDMESLKQQWKTCYVESLSICEHEQQFTVQLTSQLTSILAENKLPSVLSALSIVAKIILNVSHKTDVSSCIKDLLLKIAENLPQDQQLSDAAYMSILNSYLSAVEKYTLKYESHSVEFLEVLEKFDSLKENIKKQLKNRMSRVRKSVRISGIQKNTVNGLQTCNAPLEPQSPIKVSENIKPRSSFLARLSPGSAGRKSQLKRQQNTPKIIDDEETQFVEIKSIKSSTGPLTEHQKDVATSRRYIPALYQDLTQDSLNFEPTWINSENSNSSPQIDKDIIPISQSQPGLKLFQQPGKNRNEESTHFTASTEYIDKAVTRGTRNDNNNIDKALEDTLEVSSGRTNLETPAASKLPLETEVASMDLDPHEAETQPLLSTQNSSVVNVSTIERIPISVSKGDKLLKRLHKRKSNMQRMTSTPNEGNKETNIVETTSGTSEGEDSAKKVAPTPRTSARLRNKKLKKLMMKKQEEEEEEKLTSSKLTESESQSVFKKKAEGRNTELKLKSPSSTKTKNLTENKSAKSTPRKRKLNLKNGDSPKRLNKTYVISRDVTDSDKIAGSRPVIGAGNMEVQIVLQNVEPKHKTNNSSEFKEQNAETPKISGTPRRKRLFNEVGSDNSCGSMKIAKTPPEVDSDIISISSSDEDFDVCEVMPKNKPQNAPKVTTGALNQTTVLQKSVAGKSAKKSCTKSPKEIAGYKVQKSEIECLKMTEINSLKEPEINISMKKSYPCADSKNKTIHTKALKNDNRVSKFLGIMNSSFKGMGSHDLKIPDKAQEFQEVPKVEKRDRAQSETQQNHPQVKGKQPGIATKLEATTDPSSSSSKMERSAQKTDLGEFEVTGQEVSKKYENLTREIHLLSSKNEQTRKHIQGKDEIKSTLEIGLQSLKNEVACDTEISKKHENVTQEICLLSSKNEDTRKHIQDKDEIESTQEIGLQSSKNEVACGTRVSKKSASSIKVVDIVGYKNGDNKNGKSSDNFGTESSAQRVDSRVSGNETSCVDQKHFSAIEPEIVSKNAAKLDSENCCKVPKSPLELILDDPNVPGGHVELTPKKDENKENVKNLIAIDHSYVSSSIKVLDVQSTQDVVANSQTSEVDLSVSDQKHKFSGNLRSSRIMKLVCSESQIHEKQRDTEQRQPMRTRRSQAWSTRTTKIIEMVPGAKATDSKWDTDTTSASERLTESISQICKSPSILKKPNQSRFSTLKSPKSVNFADPVTQTREFRCSDVSFDSDEEPAGTQCMHYGSYVDADKLYGPLQNCQDDVWNLIPYLLVNPTWETTLSEYFEKIGLQTIGQLSKMSLSAAKCIPAGDDRVQTLRNSLKKYEKNIISTEKEIKKPPEISEERNLTDVVEKSKEEGEPMSKGCDTSSSNEQHKMSEFLSDVASILPPASCSSFEVRDIPSESSANSDVVFVNECIPHMDLCSVVEMSHVEKETLGQKRGEFETCKEKSLCLRESSPVVSIDHLNDNVSHRENSNFESGETLIQQKDYTNQILQDKVQIEDRPCSTETVAVVFRDEERTKNKDSKFEDVPQNKQEIEYTEEAERSKSTQMCETKDTQVGASNTKIEDGELCVQKHADDIAGIDINREQEVCGSSCITVCEQVETSSRSSETVARTDFNSCEILSSTSSQPSGAIALTDFNACEIVSSALNPLFEGTCFSLTTNELRSLVLLKNMLTTLNVVTRDLNCDLPTLLSQIEEKIRKLE